MRRTAICSSLFAQQSYAGHQNHEQRLSATATPDDAAVVSGSENGEILCWDLVEGNVVQRINAHNQSVTAVLTLRRADGATTVVSCSRSGEVKVFAH